MTLAKLYHSGNRALLTTLTLCVLVAAATAARAGTECSEHASRTAAAGTQTIRVSYADLNLATDAGSRALYQRITAAAHKVCAVSDIRDLAGLAADQSCERAAVTQAVNAVHSARLAGLNARAQQRG
jgi:UrcA family protein